MLTDILQTFANKKNVMNLMDQNKTYWVVSVIKSNIYNIIKTKKVSWNAALKENRSVK